MEVMMTLKNRIYLIAFILLEFVGLLFLFAYVAVEPVEASDNAIVQETFLPTPAEQGKNDLQPPHEKIARTSTLRRLALALSSGNGALRSFHGSPSAVDPDTDRLPSLVPGMECSIDRLLSYVSCYSSPIETEEAADTLFISLVDAVNDSLPPEAWNGLQKEPGIDSIRSYTYEDQESDAHIDIDIIAQARPTGQSSYLVSIFGWTY
jgi:hypothetical protein